MALGFDHVASGPLVRSSYHADQHVPQPREGIGPLAAAAASEPAARAAS
jgi:lipoic acid synthetase